MSFPITIRVKVRGEPTSIPVRVNNLNQSIPVGVSSSVRPVISPNYEDLENLPSINGVTLIGDKSSADLGIDQTFVYQQNVASDEWVIEHNLGRFPTVTVVDSAGTVVVGEVRYIDSNTIRVKFIGAFSGNAYLN